MIVLVIFCMIAAVSSQDQVYCGRRLATALAYFCEDNLIKRSDLPYHESKDEISPKFEIYEPEYLWPIKAKEFPAFENVPFVTHHKAQSIGRSKRQIVSECCHKRCAVEELLSYCGN